MQRRGDSGNWSLPGGIMEVGETLGECAVRETREETGLDIAITGLLGIYTDPQHVIAYANGEVRQEFAVVYYGRVTGGEIAESDESTEVRFMLYLQSEPPDWTALFDECRAEAFHLEVGDVYAVPTESERFRRFLEGEPALPDEHKNRWNDLIRETTRRGVVVGRVRVVTVPHTDYHRWLLSVTDTNTAAGEDIRYVLRHLAGEVPPDDWWLLDNERVVYNMVGADRKPAGLAVTADAGIVGYCRSVKERLWASAIPYGEYVGRARATDG